MKRKRFCFVFCLFCFYIQLPVGSLGLRLEKKKWLCTHLEHVKDKIQIMIAFKHIQRIQNRPDESFFAYGEVQLKR